MRVLVLILLVKMAAMKQDPEPASQQMVDFKKRTKGPVGVMTTSAGAPIGFNDARHTLNRRLIFNEYFKESLTRIVREKIPPRIVHAKGAGAFGYFKVTHDITDICKADLFSKVGKKTLVAIRFSSRNSEKGATDTTRDVRGFAVKFYTKEGNFDIVGFSTPVYFIKDPIFYTSSVRTQKINPATNLLDSNMLWDFMTLTPESFYIFLYIFGDRGIPDGYRHMPGYSVHTYQLMNKDRVMSFVRFYFIPDAGIKNLRSEQAMKIDGVDPNYATRDLYNAIGRGDFPGWTVKIQVLSLEDVKTAGFDVFDVTKVLPLDKYPLRPLGRFVLNKNPINYFAEIEQLAYSPANLVPGILGAPDKVFEARRLAYRDAQYYRLGANFYSISVNFPINSQQLTYNRDGRPPVRDNGRDIPNYYPNDNNGPIAYNDTEVSELVEIYQDTADNFDQTGEFFRKGMTKEERSRLIQNILFSLGSVVEEVQAKAINIFKIIHPHLGNRIEEGLCLNSTRYLVHESIRK